MGQRKSRKTFSKTEKGNNKKMAAWPKLSSSIEGKPSTPTIGYVERQAFLAFQLPRAPCHPSDYSLVSRGRLRHKQKLGQTESSRKDVKQKISIDTIERKIFIEHRASSSSALLTVARNDPMDREAGVRTARGSSRRVVSLNDWARANSKYSNGAENRVESW